MTLEPPPHTTHAHAAHRLRRLLGWSAAALVVFRAVDTGTYELVERRAPILAAAANLRLTSLTLLALAFAASSVDVRLSTPGMLRRDRAALRALLPKRRGAIVLYGLVALGLVGVLLFAELAGVRKVTLPDWQDRVAFALTGALGEELLNRGLVLGSALAIWPTGYRALVWSSSVFAAQHLQYHGFRLDLASVTQLAWTLPTGFLFAAIAARTRSLVPTMVIHVVNNSLTLLT